MKQKLLLKTLLLLCALVAGSSSSWATDPTVLFHESFGNNQHSNGSYTSKQNKSKDCSSDEEIIFDVHNSREVNKKIIPKDEGEYVDFTEE